MLLFERLPNHNVPVHPDSAEQRPASDLSTIATQQINGMQPFPIAALLEAPVEILIERSVIEKLGNQPSITSNGIKVPALFKRCDQIRHGNSINYWNHSIDHRLVVAELFDQK